jgi:hypothetical protein
MGTICGQEGGRRRTELGKRWAIPAPPRGSLPPRGRRRRRCDGDGNVFERARMGLRAVTAASTRRGWGFDRGLRAATAALTGGFEWGLRPAASSGDGGFDRGLRVGALSGGGGFDRRRLGLLGKRRRVGGNVVGKKSIVAARTDIWLSVTLSQISRRSPI